ncbi:MAG: sigma 54-interacting transcriptional regulator [Myxococcales bacterium]|nr:sigma 54-interacting transcriptional regulator [Myxococcales bacterium]
MEKVDPLDRPAVRNALSREVDPALGGLLADLEPAEAGAERPSERVAREGAGYHARLIQIYRRLAREDDIGRLLAQVVDAIMELCHAERGVAVLLPWREGQARVEVVRELATGSDGASFSRSIIDRVLATGEPILSVDAASDDRFDGSRSISHLHLRSVLGIPLFCRGELVGAAYVDHRLRRGAFDEDDLAVVEELVELASQAIVHARTLAILREQTGALEAQGRELAELLEERELEVRGLREQVRGGGVGEATAPAIYRGMVGTSAAMQAVFRLIDRVADADVPVVIYGESGTGKELVARAIHDAGARKARPFVAENCGAIPESLLESVLFGHAKGAFTGAHKASAGLFEAAHGGTIFLDEVGEMSPAMQTKLLRVLQEGEVRRVGDTSPRKIDVRVIAASNRNLEAMVAAGTFRGDLYYRIQVVKISLPPLRDRTEDLAPLIEHFLARYDRERRLSFAASALRFLARYPWPGNVRELENEIQRLAVLVESRVEAEDLSPRIREAAEGGGAPDPDDLALRPRIDRLERELIARALERAEGNQTRAAELLGLSRYGLQKKLRRMSGDEVDGDGG